MGQSRRRPTGGSKEEASMYERFKMRLTSLSWALLSSTAPFLELEWNGGGGEEQLGASCAYY